MKRLLALTALASTALLAVAALAQTPATPGPKLQYRLSTGGLLAGTFNAIEIPALGIALNGDDVVVTPLSGKFDGRRVTLSAGAMKDFTYKKLQQMIGQQMSVKISIVPTAAGPGKRCRIILDRAKLEKLELDKATFKPSETPEFKCS